MANIFYRITSDYHIINGNELFYLNVIAKNFEKVNFLIFKMKSHTHKQHLSKHVYIIHMM